MRKIGMRQLVAIIGCIVVGVILFIKSYIVQAPIKKELTRVEGIVESVSTETRTSRYRSTDYPVIKLEGYNVPFEYLDWFPGSESIRQKVHQGDSVSLLIDNHSWIWELNKGGQNIVDYDDVLEAVEDNHRYDPLMGSVLLLFGLYKLRSVVKKKH